MWTPPSEEHFAFPHLLDASAAYAPLLFLISGLNTFPGWFLDQPNSTVPLLLCIHQGLPSA